jgi:hypothetical protein
MQNIEELSVDAINTVLSSLYDEAISLSKLAAVEVVRVLKPAPPLPEITYAMWSLVLEIGIRNGSLTDVAHVAIRLKDLPEGTPGPSDWNQLISFLRLNEWTFTEIDSFGDVIGTVLLSASASYNGFVTSLMPIYIFEDGCAIGYNKPTTWAPAVTVKTLMLTQEF